MRTTVTSLLLAICFAAALVSCWTVAQPREARRVLYYRDPMHPSYRSDRPGIAPDCQMALAPVYADDVQQRQESVRLDQAQENAIGLRTEPAREETQTGEIRSLGRVEIEESRLYAVTAGADGWVRRIYGGESGSHVVKGQPLASYYSRDIISPQQAYLYAFDSFYRLHTTATPEQRELAGKQMRETRDYLEFIGMTASQIAELERNRDESREVTLGSPAPGFVLERKVSEGSRFARGDVLWKIANIDSVWVTTNLYPDELSSISGTGTATVILPDGSEARATVDSSLPRYEEENRAVKLRLRILNTGHKLLPGMFVPVRIAKRVVRGLTVPEEAVIESGIRPRVFVRTQRGTLEARAVSTGRRDGDRLQVLSGLKPGDQVVVSGAFLIDSESRLNEGP